MRVEEPDYYVDPWHILHEGTNVFTDDVMRLLVEGTEGTFYNELYRSD